MRHNETAAEANAATTYFTNVILLFYEITTDVHEAWKIFNMASEYFRNSHSKNMILSWNILYISLKYSGMFYLPEYKRNR